MRALNILNIFSFSIFLRAVTCFSLDGTVDPSSRRSTPTTFCRVIKNFYSGTSPSQSAQRFHQQVQVPSPSSPTLYYTWLFIPQPYTSRSNCLPCPFSHTDLLCSFRSSCSCLRASQHLISCCLSSWSTCPFWTLSCIGLSWKSVVGLPSSGGPATWCYTHQQACDPACAPHPPPSKPLIFPQLV